MIDLITAHAVAALPIVELPLSDPNERLPPHLRTDHTSNANAAIGVTADFMAKM